MRNILFILIAGMMALSCGNPEEKVISLATENIRLSVDNPNDLKILGISKVDSAFGINYFTDKELRGLFDITQKVTEKVMSHTENLTNFETADAIVMSLLERQMKASSEVRELLTKNSKKGDFSGYKLKIDYQCTDVNGRAYKAERWFFTDKSGRQVLKTFEIPLI